jgi:predicted chitinase
MPLDPNKTLNGVDLNEVDTSKMALVDKEGLLEDLGKRLKQEIKESVTDAVEATRELVNDIVAEAVENNQPATPTSQAPSANEPTSEPPQNSSPAPSSEAPAPPKSSRQKRSGGGGGPRAPKGGDDDFTKAIRVQQRTQDLLKRIYAVQRKNDKEARSKNLKENTYTDKGKAYGEGIDDIASGYHGFDRKELEEGQKRLAEIQENIRFYTSGKEQKLLTETAKRLENELKAESKKRETVLGRIGGFLDKENINAASIMTGILGDSPMAGLMTKATLEMVRHFKEKKQKRRAEQFKVGDLSKKLPRPDLPAEKEDRELEVNPKIIREQVGAVAAKGDSEAPEVVHSALENLSNRNQVSDEEHQNMKVEYLKPEFRPMWEKMPEQVPSPERIPQPMPQAHTQPQAPGQPQQGPQQARQPGQLIQMPQPAPEAPEEPESIQQGPYQVGIPDWQEYLWSRRRTPTAKEGEEAPGAARFNERQISADQQGGWMDHLVNRAKEQQQEKLAEMEQMGEELDPIFGEPIHRKPQRIPLAGLADDFKNPVRPLMKKRPKAKILQMPTPVETATESPDQLPVEPEHVGGNTHMTMAAKEQVAPTMTADEEMIPHPEQAGSEAFITLLQEMNDTLSKMAEETKSIALHNDNGFTKLEKVSSLQLEELKRINKSLDKQIESTDAANDAAMRETKDKAPTGEDGGTGKGMDKKALEAMLSKMGKGGGGLMGIAETLIEAFGLKKLAGGVATFGKGLLGKAKGLFGRGAGTAAEGAEGIAGAGEAGAAGAEGVAGAGAAGAEGGAVAAAEGGAVAAGEGAAGGAAAGGLGAVAAPAAAVGGGILGGIGLGHLLEKVIGKKTLYDDEKVGPNHDVSAEDATDRAAEWLKANGVDSDRHWYQPYKMWASSTWEKFGDLNKNKPGDFKQWIRTKDPEMAHKLFSFEDEKKKPDKEAPAKTEEEKKKIEGKDTPKDGPKEGEKPSDATPTATVPPLAASSGAGVEGGPKRPHREIVRQGEHPGEQPNTAPEQTTTDQPLPMPPAQIAGINPIGTGLGTPTNIGTGKTSLLPGIAAPTNPIGTGLGTTSPDLTQGTATPLMNPQTQTDNPGQAVGPDSVFSFDASKIPPTVRSLISLKGQLPENVALVDGMENKKFQEFLKEIGRTSPSRVQPPPAPLNPTTPTTATPGPSVSPKPASGSGTGLVGTMHTREVEGRTFAPKQNTAPEAQTKPTPVPTDDGYNPVFSPPRQREKEGSEFAPTKISGAQQKHIDAITEELKSQGMNEKQIAAVIGNVGKESGFALREENLNYKNTSNDRIRSVFGKERTNMSDDELSSLKQDPEKFGEAMYGKGSRIGKGMGNLEEGDGYKFRGRGYIQLTGRNNYAKASKEIFGDDRLVKNPELVNQPEVASKVVGWYTKNSGDHMAKSMGIDLQNGSQEDINLAYTSAIAGRKIRRGDGYLGNEVMSKVDNYASASTQGQSPVMVASNVQPKPQMPTSQPATDAGSVQTASLNQNIPSLAAPSPSMIPAMLADTPMGDRGMRLTQANTESKDLSRQLVASAAPSHSNTVIAPSTVTQNTSVVDVKALNDEDTYRRTMNFNYVQT